MNWKIIGVFSFSLFGLGVLSGIPFGIWEGTHEQFEPTLWFYGLQYVVGFVIGVPLYFLLFKFQDHMPVCHAYLVALISNLVGVVGVYIISGDFYPMVMLVVSLLLETVYIFTARFIYKVSRRNLSNA